MSKKYTIIVSACLLLALALVIALTAALGENAGAASEQTGAAEKNSDSPFCVLVLGQDKVSGLTDVIMLAVFDIANEKISVMQIPRDTYADYGSGYRKINGALKYLGSERKLCEFISNAFAVRIDGYVRLGLDAFRDAVDTVGGVEFELEKAIKYKDPEQGLYIDLPAGKQVLDGKRAEMLVRFRSGYLRGDLDRLDVQKQFLVALFNKLKSSVNLSNAYGLASKILPRMSTDISIPLAVALGLKALSVDTADIAFLTLPGEDVISKKSGGSYYVMSVEPTRDALGKFFFAEGETDTEGRFKNRNDKIFCDIYAKNFKYSVFYPEKVD